LTFNDLGEASYEAQPLGHSKIESAVRYQAEVDDYIKIAEKIETIDAILLGADSVGGALGVADGGDVDDS
jgi:hypothetical protein